MTTLHWILFGLFLAAHGVGFVLAMCYAAKRGDELMEEAIKEAKV